MVTHGGATVSVNDEQPSAVDLEQRTQHYNSRLAQRYAVRDNTRSSHVSNNTLVSTWQVISENLSVDRERDKSKKLWS